MNLYFLPASDSGLKNNIFQGRSVYKGGVSNMNFWYNFALACKAMGIHLSTYDAWSREKSKPDDILFVQNHPGETAFWRTFYFFKNLKSTGGFMLKRRTFLFRNYEFFKRRVLWQGESPMVVPYIYRKLDRLKESGMYQKIFLLSRRHGDYVYFNYFNYLPYPPDDVLISPNFNDPKEKFLVMINTNARPRITFNEFYGERLKAIKYFSKVGGLDLYGYGWDKAPRHFSYLHYGTYVRKVFRGIADDKVKTLSEYTFTLCFENCAYPGYVSEKIFDCLAAGSIPIYLGAPDVEKIIPKWCFIDFKKFGSYKKLHQFLLSRKEADLENYRRNIRTFLEDTSSRKTMDSFVEQVIGSDILPIE